MPDLDGFSTHVRQEVHAQSRTISSGLVNSSSEKAHHLLGAAGVEHEANENVERALNLLTASNPLDATEWRELLIGVNQALTAGTIVTPGALRDFDVPGRPYLAAEQIPVRLDELAGTLAGLSAVRTRPAVEVAFAAIHWEVNLSGHLFADGCGRTAVVLGNFVAWSWADVLPRLPPRDEYLGLTDGGGSWSDFVARLSAATKW